MSRVCTCEFKTLLLYSVNIGYCEYVKDIDLSECRLTKEELANRVCFHVMKIVWTWKSL